MSYTLGRRVFLGYLAVIAAVVVVVGVAVDQFMRGHIVEIVADELDRKLALVQEIYERDPHLSPDARAESIAALVGLRVTAIAPDGRVIGESDVPGERLADLENHAGRPEVREARERGMGRDIRWSRSVGRDLIYLATELDDGTVLRLARPLDEVRTIVAETRIGIAAIGVVAVALAALLTFLLSRSIAGPIRRMAETARAMGDGDLERRAEPPRIREFAELATALNALARDLRHRLSELEAERGEMQILIDSMREGVLAFSPDGTLRQSNPSAQEIFSLHADRGIMAEEVSRRPELHRLVREALEGGRPDTAETRAADRDLLATARPLPDGGAVVVVLDVSDRRRADAIRREFVANASHELKTPLTTLRGYAETLLDDDLPPDLRRQFTETVHRNAERMQRIVDDLLDLSRIEAGRWELRPEWVDARAATAEIFEGLAERAEERAVELYLEVEEDASSLHVDPSAYRLVVGNLVDNALRHSPEGGRVTVRLRRRDEASLLIVEDHGSGIPAAHLPRIFERFYRADAGRARAGGGTGLGLSIVKHLVEAHGGRVRAESELGAGTTIEVDLPQPATLSP